MKITVACTQCGRRYDVAGRLAGRRVRCKDCANVFRVPVPQTMPRSERPSRKRSKSPYDSLDEWLAPSGEAEPAAPTPEPAPGTLLPDWGATRTYRWIQAGAFALLGVSWWLGLGSTPNMTIGLLLTAGAFGLLPLLGGWPSFEESRATRTLARAVGTEGVRMARATASLALWILAVLILVGAVEVGSEPARPADVAPEDTAPQPADSAP